MRIELKVILNRSLLLDSKIDLDRQVLNARYYMDREKIIAKILINLEVITRSSRLLNLIKKVSRD